MNRKKTARILCAAFLYAAATSAALLEITGYAPFDNPEAGTNALCDLDPTCRPMTQGEKTLAAFVFGPNAVPETTKIFNRLNFVTTPLKRLAGYKGIAEAPNGNIYIKNNDLHVDDYAHHPGRQPLFLHELTHVWQKTQNRNLAKEAVTGYIAAGLDQKKMYLYDPAKDRDFFKLGLEQQASAIEDYWRLRVKFEAAAIQPKDYLKKCEDIRLYESLIGQALPVAPYFACPQNTIASQALLSASLTPNPIRITPQQRSIQTITLR